MITPVSLVVAAFIAKRTYEHVPAAVRRCGASRPALWRRWSAGPEGGAGLWSRERDCLEKFDEINERLRKCSLRAIFFSSITNPSTRFVNSLVYAGVGIVGALSVIGGGLSVGQLSSLFKLRQPVHQAL